MTTKTKYNFLILLLLVLFYFIFFRKEQIPQVQNDNILDETEQDIQSHNQKPKVQSQLKNAKLNSVHTYLPSTQPKDFANAPPTIQNPKPNLKTEISNKETENTLHFKLEDGMVVVQGDLVLGVPTGSDVPLEGLVEMPQIKLWEDGLIPFSISSSVPNPKRILDAFQLFKETPIEFTPIDTHQNGIVFVEGQGTCKSYLGCVGGLQALWVAPDCTASDIAHEIMHALGFVHEQNRTDRDQFVNINWQNIDKNYIHNFELLPKSLMLVSGEGDFDYQSIMMYHEMAFALNRGQKTLSSKTQNKINPLKMLSKSDIQRLIKVYGKQ